MAIGCSGSIEGAETVSKESERLRFNSTLNVEEGLFSPELHLNRDSMITLLIQTRYHEFRTSHPDRATCSDKMLTASAGPHMLEMQY